MFCAKVSLFADRVTNEVNMLCYTGNSEGQKGIGFWIKKEWGEKLIEYKGISDRIAAAVWD